MCAAGAGPDHQLPPRAQWLPHIDQFFNYFNLLIPIFHRPTFMGMFNDWYDNPHGQNEASWGAIQVVVALGLHAPMGGPVYGNPSDVSVANRCLKNAQAVVAGLVTRDQDLLGIQVLLGIAFLLGDSSDLGPSSVVVGAAVRLAHRMELQSLSSRRLLTLAEAEQRSRVFWITYTLDKVRRYSYLECRSTHL
jgi:hypothetical protein